MVTDVREVDYVPLVSMLVDEYKKVLSQVERLVRPAQNSFLQHQS